MLTNYKIGKNDRVSKMARELIKKTSDYLTYTEAFNVASASRFLLFSINDKNALQNKGDYPAYFNFKLEKLNLIIKQALTGIDTYLDKDAEKPKVNPGVTTTTDYSKGYRRATCFKDILSDKENDISFRMLALYILLHESNGIKLKSRVQENIISIHGIHFLKMIEEYLQSKFSREEIKFSEKELLRTIHDDTSGPITNNDFYYQGNFPIGFMHLHVVRILESAKYANSSNRSCVVT